MISKKLTTRIVIAVTAVWVANFVLGAIPGSDYKTDPMINGIFMSIIGTVLVAGARKGPHNGDDGGGPSA